MKSYVVIGIGRFGAAVAEELCSLGHEVLAIDDSEENIQRIADRVTHAVVGDAKDEAVLKSLGVRNYDCAIVAIGSDISDSVMATLILKEMGIKEIICKAQSSVHMKLLQKIGADLVVFPEHDSGVKLAHNLSSSNILNLIELSDDYSIAEISAPKHWFGKSIRELNIRVRYGINIIAVRSSGTDGVQISPQADYEVKPGDVLFAVGTHEALNISQEE
ncbi:potassium channel family protein [Papillibacter cinnamivorans]|uniref:Trk system potassium uptake protein TrkA n=1 Tax=Papillibacter cinnamivorans DSM 12816 TaxID=1122930 RepID=A0A1W1ZEA1_9FIRM|nr:TrkA family potassium uptake protein [Papillibacter cinnamivorans]SMC46805.1 trk system potassium uptake protein TrkA [Papillibacter cinnamivorans DSM 12816]